MYTYQGVCSPKDVLLYTYIYKTFNIILFVRDGIKDSYCQENAINHWLCGIDVIEAQVGSKRLDNDVFSGFYVYLMPVSWVL